VQLMRFASPLVLALAFAAAVPASAAAQPVTASDVQRLQDDLDDASRSVAQMRSRDANLASQLQTDLHDASEEATYLKVKLRKNETISRREYLDVRDRVDNIRSRARGDAPNPSVNDDRPVSTAGYPDRAPYPNDNHPSSSNEANTVRSQNPNEIPVSTEFDVRLQNSLSSKTANVEDRFEATTMVDLRDERGRVLIPAGSLMRGIVSSVHPATRTERKGSMTVAFDRVTVNGRAYPIRATVSQAIESEGIAGEKEKIGIGAGAGAILGAILGGAKGALAGILIGGGGTIAATEGNDVELPSGTVLRVRLDSPLNMGR
jgi:hypothetical protein